MELWDFNVMTSQVVQINVIMHGHGFGQCEEQMHILQPEFHEFNKFQNHLTTHMNLVVRMYA